MKTSLTLLLVFGACYLFILEDIGKFVESHLGKYKKSLEAQEPLSDY